MDGQPALCVGRPIESKFMSWKLVVGGACSPLWARNWWHSFLEFNELAEIMDQCINPEFPSGLYTETLAFSITLESRDVKAREDSTPHHFGKY